ncbi:abortive infection system antitoxin AbiGi family protein [Pantoea agglomerans]|uniref:abortive infection system antitoxin AbiGi family protein n=1 Tax=Enterobacter agglomerans TaxID=549 RepID=UPI003C79FBE5
MSRSLYPTTLFHFTEKLDTLFEILDSSNFRISYAREFIQGQSTNRNFGIPMISFCDIRLTQLTQHTESYGHYGIGLSKDWANENGLNPVIYMSKQSAVFDNYNLELRSLKAEVDKLSKSLEEIKSSGTKAQLTNSKRKYNSALLSYKKIVDPLRYMKNYQATLRRRNGPEQPNYIFADEREWRFVPDIEKSNGRPMIAAAKNISTEDGKRKYNEYYDNDRLPFSHKDIKYVIVKHESDVEKMMDFLHVKYGSKSSLIPRVLSTESIANDM